MKNRHIGSTLSSFLDDGGRAIARYPSAPLLGLGAYLPLFSNETSKTPRY